MNYRRIVLSMNLKLGLPLLEKLQTPNSKLHSKHQCSCMHMSWSLKFGAPNGARGTLIPCAVPDSRTRTGGKTH